MKIRKATTDDISLIRRMAEETFPATYREIITEEQIAWMMEWMYSHESLKAQMDGGHVYYIAFDDNGSPQGYVSVERQGERLFHLQKIYVLPTAQGTGLGRTLFQTAVDHVRREGGEGCRMELNVNRYNKALSFYERMGMRRDREGDFPIGNGFFMNDFIMALDV